LVGRNLVLRVAAFAALALAMGLTTSMLLATFFDFATLPMRIALGTAMGSLVFFLATGVALLQRIKTRLRWLTIARLLVASAAAIGVGRVLPQDSMLMGLLAVVIAGIVYVVTLIATGELGRSDWALLRKRGA